MDAASWTSIGSTIVLLAAISTGFRSLRAEMQQLRERMDAQSEQIGPLRERMAKLEGLLEGLREAISGRRPA